jgi:hypothetical protein
MRHFTVHLLKPAKNTTITYQGELLHEQPGYVVLLARWDRPALNLGYVVFEPGDHFYEHYYAERWFNIFEVRAAHGELKGWYCNVTRPARIEGDTVLSEDLELDLFVPPERDHLLRLDLEEFEARGFAAAEPATYAAALAALDELERMARSGLPPFDREP